MTEVRAGLVTAARLVRAPHLVRARRARDKLAAAAGELVRARRYSSVDPPDYLQVLASASGLDGELVAEEQIVREILSTVFAGHDSTTGHLGWAVIDLLQHPGELAEVLAEQHEVVSDGTALDLAAVHRMARLDRALRETIRLHPVVPLMIRRAVRPVEVRGRPIPEGADVFIAPVLSHRLPHIFEDPETYRPDRYLTHPEQASYLHGFGGGGHRCLGEHFADLLAHVALTQLFQQFGRQERMARIARDRSQAGKSRMMSSRWPGRPPLSPSVVSPACARARSAWSAPDTS
jgi:sterol 14-demethylase